MAEFQQGVAKNGSAPTIFDRFLEELDILVHAGNNVEDMVDALSQLRALRDDFREAIRMSPQQRRPEQVENWFRRVEEVDARVDQIQQDYRNRCQCAGSFSPNIFSSYGISRRAVQKKAKVKGLLREYDTLKNLSGERPPVSCIPKHLPTAIVGKSSYLAQVLVFLEDDQTSIISICGMAGVGKSELLRCVNNQFLPGTDKADDFRFVIWVDCAISDVKSIQDEIAQRLKLEDLGPWEDGADAERRATPIFKFLKDTSFLVLLDNLTTTVCLADIGIPNPKFRHRSSWKQKVVMTTRFKGLCGRMGSCTGIDMECLDEDESWKLVTAAVSDEQLINDREIQGFARQIATECGGLPIALVRIGGAMATKRQPDDWSRTAKFLQISQVHRIPGMEREITAMLQDLKRSYDHVPSPNDRECFLCCALWPRDRPISKADLIDCWSGLGLIRESLPDDTTQKGFSIISSLQEANLLLPGGDIGDQVKLQPVVRDMALWIACDCGQNDSKWLVEAGVDLGAKHKLIQQWQRAAAAERVSLMHNSIQQLPQPRMSALSCSSLTVLMLQHNKTFTDIPGAFLRSAPALAYLDLSHTAIEELPEDIGTLEMLRYLNLSFTQLRSLPTGLRNLGRLKHILLRNTNHLSVVPKGVFCSLPSLQVIDMYPSRYMDWEDSEDNLGTEGIASFEQMGSTSQAFIQFLGITISTFGIVRRLGCLVNVCTRRLLLTHFRSPQTVIICPSHFKVVMRSFSLLETLMELSIAECPTIEQLVFDGEEEERKRNESWCLPKLEILELRSLSKLAAIIWKSISISYFLPAIQHVKIENCSSLENLTWVVHLHSLHHLEVHNCTKMRSIVEDHEPRDGGEQPHTFSSLMTLILVNLKELCSICSPRTSFPWLEVIQVEQCMKLSRLHIRPQGRLRKIKGTMEWWNGLEWGTDNNFQASLSPYFSAQ
ncbi:unnamed protein product [Urochloa humidicola]